MTCISTRDIQHLAELSGLQLDAGEVDGLRSDLEKIVGNIEQLGELDTSGVIPTYQVTSLENVWRDDDMQTDVGRDTLLGLAPEAQNNQVKVPQVL